MPITIPMPYGIPVPPIDFMEEIPAWPAQWANNEPVSSYYYVDSTHPNVQRVHNGTPQEPAYEIPSLLGPGTLCVVRNLYTRDAAGKTTILVAGTAGEWVAGYNGKAFLDFGRGEDRAAFLFQLTVAGHYGIFDGATNEKTRNKTWQIGTSSAIPSHDTSNLVVRNFDFYGDGITESTAAQVVGHTSGSNGCDNVVVYNCKIKGWGDLDYPPGKDIDANGMIVNGRVSNLWILHNEIEFTSGAGIQLATTNVTDATRNIYIGKNKIHDICQAGIAMKYPSDVVVSQNSIARCRDKSNTPSKGIGVQYAPINIWLLFNEIIDCRFGIRGAGTNLNGTPTNGWPMYAIGNIISGASTDKMALEYSYSKDSVYDNFTAFASMGNYQFYISNNLAIGCDFFFNAPSAGEKYTIVNNIILKTKYSSLYFDNNTFSSWVSNNLFSSHTAEIRRTGGLYNTGIQDMETITNVRDNLEFNDDYLDSMTYEEKLAELKGIGITTDKGVDLPEDLSQLFFDTFGIEFNRGIEDRVIPQGVVRDIGPWEKGELLVDVLPAAPSDFHISSSTNELLWVLNSINEDSVSVYKNGELLEELPKYTNSYYIADLLSSVDSYKIHVTNIKGTAYSELIYSKDMAVEPSVADVRLDNATAYLLPREDKRLDSNSIAYPMPVANRDFYGTGNTNVAFLLNEEVVSNGYLYINDLTRDDYIEVDLTKSTGRVNITFVTGNTSSSVAGQSEDYTYYVTLEDTTYTLVNTGGLTKHTIEFDIVSSDSVLSITPKGVYKYGMMGISTIYTETPDDVVAPPDETNTDFTYVVQSGSRTVKFTNPDGVTSGEWIFGDGNTSNVISPTHTYVSDGSYVVKFTGANSQSVVVNTTVAAPPNFTFTKSDNVVSFFSDGASGVWDFGDGTTYTGTNPVKTFPVGNYGVSLAGGNKTWINIHYDPKYTPEGEVTERVVALGDSITAAGDVTGSNDYRYTSLNISSYNRGPWTSGVSVITNNDYIVEDGIGKSGYRTDQLISSGPLDSVLVSNATLVLIMVGANDVAQGRSLALAKADYKTIVDTLVASNKKVLILPVAHTNVDGSGDVALNANVDNLNSYLLTLENEDNSVRVAEVNTEYNTLLSQDSLLVTRDGTHPNNRGGMLLGENPALVLDTYYPSSVIKDSKIIGFSGTGGSSDKPGSVPDGWNALYGKLWEPNVMYNGSPRLKVTSSGLSGDTIGNKTRLRLGTFPTGLEEGWYILEMKCIFVNPDDFYYARVAVETASDFGLGEFSAFSPHSKNVYKPDVEYRLRTLKIRVGANDAVSYLYFDSTQFTNGEDVVFYISEPLLYKVADI